MHSEKQKAIFLDRDGVLIEERGDYTFHLEDCRINNGVIEALKIFSERGYLLIIISNQGGIALNIYSKEQANFLHSHLERNFKNSGITLTEIYYCPHHPKVSKCLCRKPDSLMLEKAIARYNIDASLSYFIGDADRDIEAGNKAGLKTVKIAANSSLLNVINFL